MPEEAPQEIADLVLRCTGVWLLDYVIVYCRVPEEAPQEIADLVLRCTGDADKRPDALECAQIIDLFCPGGSGRRHSPKFASLSGERIGVPRQPGQAAGASGQIDQQVGFLKG